MGRTLQKILVTCLFTFVTLLPGLLFPSAAHAINCQFEDSKDIQSFNSSVQGLDAVSKNFRAYIKLGESTQKASSRIVQQFSGTADSQCTEIATVIADGTNWTYAGNVQAANEYTEITVEVTDPLATQGASAPKLLLIPLDSVCADPNQCSTKYDGEELSYIPQQISVNFDTLKILLHKDLPSDAALKRVTYYQDGKELYRSRTNGTLQDSYVSIGEHTLAKVLTFDSGVILRKTWTLKKPDSLMGYFSPTVMRNISLLRFLGILILIYSAYLAVLFYARKIFLYRRWRQTHIINSLARKNSSETKTAAGLYSEYKQSEEQKRNAKLFALSIFLPLVLLGLFYVTTTWMISVFTVDGISMETTLHNKSKQALYKYPVTFSALTGHDYTPRRGEIIVFQKEYLGIDELYAQQEDSYVVKRVIALPGERVVMKGTGLQVYNAQHPEGFTPDKPSGWENILSPTQPRSIDITLGDGEIFVVGDDRDYSTDSRDYGPIKQSQIIGTVKIKADPLKKPYVFNEADLR